VSYSLTLFVTTVGGAVVAVDLVDVFTTALALVFAFFGGMVNVFCADVRGCERVGVARSSRDRRANGCRVAKVGSCEAGAEAGGNMTSVWRQERSAALWHVTTWRGRSGRLLHSLHHYAPYTTSRQTIVMLRPAHKR
jgi:hypothetical protein